MFHVPPGTLVIYGDIACPWATLAVVRLWEARARHGLDDAVRFDALDESAYADLLRRAADTR